MLPNPELISRKRNPYRGIGAPANRKSCVRFDLHFPLDARELLRSPPARAHFSPCNAFCICRDLGRGGVCRRLGDSIAALSRHPVACFAAGPRRNGRRPTKCPRAWTALSSRYHWVQRAVAYDDARSTELEVIHWELFLRRAERRAELEIGEPEEF